MLRHVAGSPRGTREIHIRWRRDERDSLSVEPGDAVAAGFNQKGNHAEITAEQPLINESVCCTRGSGIGEAAADPSDYPL